MNFWERWGEKITRVRTAKRRAHWSRNLASGQKQESTSGRRILRRGEWVRYEMTGGAFD